MEGHTFIALKAFTMGGEDIRPGDSVNVSAIGSHKLGQLLSQRYLRPDTGTVPATEPPKTDATDA